MRVHLKNLRLIDGSGAPARDGALVIEGDTIVHVGPLDPAGEPKGPDVQAMDLGERTVIPRVAGPRPPVRHAGRALRDP
jgi:cytosine/adenosine deaminase-related metal-dependent hydrolase